MTSTDNQLHTIFSNYIFSFRWEDSNYIRFYVANGSAWSYYYSVNITKASCLNSWNHFAITVDYALTNQYVRCYFNGGEVVGSHAGNSSVSQVPNTYNNMGLLINVANYSAGLIGYCDDFRIYDNVLTLQQIQDIYNNITSSGNGAYLGLFGTNIRFRAGDANSSYGETVDTKAETEADISSYFDDKIHHMVWYINPSGTIKLWIDNNNIITATSTLALGGYADTDTLYFGSAADKVPYGESTNAFEGNLSDLLVYENQDAINTSSIVYNNYDAKVGNYRIPLSQIIKLKSENLGNYTNMSICYWVRPSSTYVETNHNSLRFDYYDITLGQVKMNSYSMMFKFENDNANVYFTDSYNSVTTSSSTNLTPLDWHFLVITLEGTNGKFYVNNSLVDTFTLTTRLDTEYFGRIG